jgi:hypothetical protein
MDESLITSGMNKEQHFVKAFEAYPIYIITDYGSGNFYDIIFTKHGRGL